MKQQEAKKPVAKKKTSVNNEVRINAKNPIPFENGRAFSFVNTTQYLPFLGENPNFGQDLLEARLSSATHNRCVVTKRRYCAGDGFVDMNKGADLEPQFVEWLSSVNMKNEPATEINKRIFEDYFTWGNVPIELVRFTSRKKKYFFVYVHNFLEWRLCKPDADDIVTHAIQSKLFLDNTVLTNDDIEKSKMLPIYNPRRREKDNWYKDENGVERTLIWYKNSVSGFQYYGLPSAVASMIYQLLEYKGARYNLDNFDNNMVVSALLALKGNLSQKEADRIGKKAIQTHTGDGKRGRVMVVASEEGIDGSSLHTFDTAKDGSYTTADDKWMQKILLANEWDAVLAGIQSPSTMGKGSGFITKIVEHINKTVILPAQQDLMDNVWDTVFKIGAEWMGWNLEAYNLAIKSNVDISGLTDVDITPAVTVDEVREAKGLPKDDSGKGNMYLGELQAKQNKKGGDNVPSE